MYGAGYVTAEQEAKIKAAFAQREAGVYEKQTTMFNDHYGAQVNAMHGATDIPRTKQ